MAIILDKDSKIVVQGFTGSQGSFHAKQCLDYGSQIVAGVTPGRGGQNHLDRPEVRQAAPDRGRLYHGGLGPARLGPRRGPPRRCLRTMTAMIV